MKTIRAKILVVDDDADYRGSITTILESASYDVVTAANIEEATRKILEDRPDLILLDIMMDSLFDGYSLCHAIRTSDQFTAARTTPIIFVSAVRRIAGSRFGFKGEDQGLTGPDDYIDKPVDPKVLLARIEKFLAK
jgi:DNA-binding response OmpR family regulator